MIKLLSTHVLHLFAELLKQVDLNVFTQIQPTGTERVEYPPHINSIIEAAFKKNKKQVEFKDASDGVCVIDFKEMVEYPKNDPQNPVVVSRRIKVKGLLFFSLQLFGLAKYWWPPNHVWRYAMQFDHFIYVLSILFLSNILYLNSKLFQDCWCFKNTYCWVVC